MPTALITGVTGQDGSYLAEQLLEQGWRVVGLMRRSASPNLWRIQHLVGQLELVEADLSDLSSLVRALQDARPEQIYNLGSQSFVAVSWRQPLYTADVTGLGAVRMLEATRLACPEARFYQAGSSEMFGLQAGDRPRDESTRFHPRSPYGCAKAYAHHMAVNYRESYGMFVVNGVLFNHESERRGREFVTRKIALAVARIAGGDHRPLKLGAMEVMRDWGFAADYTRAMQAMLRQDSPDDYVVATGEAWSVRDFAARAFSVVDLNWEDWVERDPTLLRPAEIPCLRGDASKARRVLGWSPTLPFDGLVERMVRFELERAA